MTKQIPYDLIPAADLPKVTPGAFDSVVGVDESTGEARRFPMPAAGTPRAYETRADLPASPEPGTAAYVNNDPDPDNNGLWAYLDGEWVQSADRVTGLEGRLSAAEVDVAGLKDFRVEADVRLEHTDREILDLREHVPSDATDHVWGVADEDGRLLIGVRSNGEFDYKKPEFDAIHDEPLLDASDDLSYAVTDEDGRLLFGVRNDGRFVANIEIPAPPVSTDDLDVFDADDGDVYVTGAEGRTLVATGDPHPFRGPMAIAGGGFRASQARPMIGADRRVAVSRDGLVVPDSPNLLTHIIGFGQSLSVGSHGLPLISTENAYPDHVLMFEGLDVRMGLTAYQDKVALDPDTLTGFEPLVAKSNAGSRGQTHMESIGETLERAAVERASSSMRMLLSTAGWGGTAYSGLKKGTIPYNNLLASVTKAKALAAAEGWAYWVPCINFQHGETDGGNANYFDALVELQSDLDADIRAITGQSAPVQFYMGQPSTFGDSATASNAVKAIYRAAKELPQYTIVCPQYAFSYAADLLHMDSEGYYRLGEYHAKAMLVEQYGAGRWMPLMPESVSRTGAQIDIAFHVPVAPLVLDTTTISDPGHYGFDFVDDSASASIASVALLDSTTVRITLTGTPTGANKRIRYALDGYADPRLPGQGPRGCLRDSDNTPSALGGALPNWCLHFEESAE